MKNVLTILSPQRILIGLLAILGVMQFFQIDKTNPESDPSLDFININNPPVEITEMLKTACYDCHSNQTRYPWYSNIAPVNWWLKDHIDHGREELNFSEWGSYNARRSDHKLEEGVEKVEGEEMPLPSYLITHGDAKLTVDQRKQLADYFQSLRTEAGGN